MNGNIEETITVVEDEGNEQARQRREIQEELIKNNNEGPSDERTTDTSECDTFKRSI